MDPLGSCAVERLRFSEDSRRRPRRDDSDMETHMEKKMENYIANLGNMGIEVLLGMFICGIPGGFVEAGASRGLES